MIGRDLPHRPVPAPSPWASGGGRAPRAVAVPLYKVQRLPRHNGGMAVWLTPKAATVMDEIKHLSPSLSLNEITERALAAYLNRLLRI